MERSSGIAFTLQDYMSGLSAPSHEYDVNFNWEDYYDRYPLHKNILSFGPICVFILDYRLKTYRYLDDNAMAMFGFTKEQICNGGIPFYLSRMHEEDRRIFTGVAFNNRLKHMHTVNQAERSQYWYSVNYRLQLADGNYSHILQYFTILQVDDQRNPLVLLGFCTDISNYKTDDKIIDAVLKWDNTKGFVTLHKKIYQPQIAVTHLSVREIEILKWLVEGLSSQDIADKLFLSRHTINTHRKNMLLKTNAKNTADLLRYAFKSGLFMA